jgi:hypothetical protein
VNTLGYVANQQARIGKKSLSKYRVEVTFVPDSDESSDSKGEKLFTLLEDLLGVAACEKIKIFIDGPSEEKRATA